MVKKNNSDSANVFDEEAVPFDEVMRTLLKAKPQPKQADKAVPKKRKSKKD